MPKDQQWVVGGEEAGYGSIVGTQLGEGREEVDLLGMPQIRDLGVLHSDQEKI